MMTFSAGYLIVFVILNHSLESKGKFLLYKSLDCKQMKRFVEQKAAKYLLKMELNIFELLSFIS